MDGIAFAKGHGTENDFVILPDPDGTLDLDADGGELIRALCHRRRGIGADGVLRVARGGGDDGSAFFMDYRNGDGSVAEMCGNGIRVFARFLVDEGLLAPGTHPIGTRAGTRTVTVGAPGTDVTVDMGPARVGSASTASLGHQVLEGVRVDVGNPHLACIAAGSPEVLAAMDVATSPRFDRALFPDGVNVEVLTPLHEGAVHLRVHERGSGETRSCGTGTVAGAVAALRHAGRDTGVVTVHTPGGALVVTVDAETTHLRGPAEIVARGAAHR